MDWNYSRPVSYTHLDVYKRQEQVLERIESGMNIYVGVDVAEPVTILKELDTIADRVKDVTICTVLGPEDYPHLHDLRGNIRTEPFFYGPFTRRAHGTGNVSLVPSSIKMCIRDRHSNVTVPRIRF